METDLTYTFPSEDGREARKLYLLHFDGVDGTFTLEREAFSLKGAYQLALELAAGRISCFVRGVELA
jgi:hypothetical protein